MRFANRCTVIAGIDWIAMLGIDWIAMLGIDWIAMLGIDKRRGMMTNGGP